MRLMLLMCAMLIGLPGPVLRLPDTVAKQIGMLFRADPPATPRAALTPRPGIAWHYRRPASPTP